MPRLFFPLIPSLFIFSTALFFSACSQEGTKQDEKYPAETGKEIKKPCPDPRQFYIPVEPRWYWIRKVEGRLRNVYQSEEYLCGQFQIAVHGIRGMPHFAFPLSEIADLKAKEDVYKEMVIRALRGVDRRLKDKPPGPKEEIYKRLEYYFPSLKEVTGLEMTSKEWFDWWLKNKDHLRLDDEGKYLIVDKNLSKNSGH